MRKAVKVRQFLTKLKQTLLSVLVLFKCVVAYASFPPQGQFVCSAFFAFRRQSFKVYFIRTDTF